MAVDSRGDVHVVWEDDSPGNNEILHRKWSGGGWSPVENLSKNAGISGSPAIAADTEGNVHVVWHDYTPGNYEILYRRWNGNAWLPIENLSGTGGTSATPALAAGPQNNAYVVWRESAFGESGIRYRTWSAGGGWSAAGNLTPGSATASAPGVAIDTAGNIHFVWVDEHPTNFEVFYRRWDGSAWSAAENLSQSARRSVSPAISAGPAGDVHVAWQDATPGNWEILYRRWSGGEWSPAENLSEDTGLSGSPALAVDAASNVHVVWMDDTSGNYEVLLRRWSRLASGWSAPENLSKNGGFSWAPAVAARLAGASHVVWEDNAPGNFDILYAGPALSPAATPTPPPIPTATPSATPTATSTPTPAPNEIRLDEGWNLISVPVPLEDPSVGAVFAQAAAVTRVFGCLGETWTSANRGPGGWSGALAQIVDGRGYFVYATEPVILALSMRLPGTPRPPPSYPLPVGWSLIGFSSSSLSSAPVTAYLSSLQGKWTSLYGIDQAGNWEIAKPGGVGFPDVRRGRGYWISMRQSGVLTP